MLEKCVHFLLLKKEMSQKMIVSIQIFITESKNRGLFVVFFLLYKKIGGSNIPSYHNRYDTNPIRNSTKFSAIIEA